MHIIIGMPPHIIIIGMPQAIICVIRSQQSFIISMVMPSIGIIVQTIPRGVISQVIRPIGIMPAIIGIMFGIIPFIMLAIIGIMFCIIGICMAGIICVFLSNSREY